MNSQRQRCLNNECKVYAALTEAFGGVLPEHIYWCTPMSAPFLHFTLVEKKKNLEEKHEFISQ